MKKTNVCEVCKKRYKMPDVLQLEIREHICLSCEIKVGFLLSLYRAYPYLLGITLDQIGVYNKLTQEK